MTVRPRKLDVLIACMLIGVVTLLFLQHFLRNRNAVEPVPQEVQTLAESLGSPLELNWILCRLAKTEGLAMTAEQRTKVAAVLEGSLTYTETVRSWWMQGERWMRQALTPEQRNELRAALRRRQITAMARGQCPMSEKLFALVRERAGLDFMAIPADDLIAMATALPFADPNPPPQDLNPEDFAYGLLALESQKSLRITRRQALQILPYLRFQNDLFQAHEMEKRRILTVLDERQREWVGRCHVEVSTAPRVPECSAEEVLAVLRAQGSSSPAI